MSSQARVFHCSVSFTEAFSQCLWGKNNFAHPLMTKHSLLIFFFHLLCLIFYSIFLIFALDIFPLSSTPEPFLHRHLLQSHADSWFVYQNIDLLSLYTSTLALLLVHFFSFSPLPKAPLTGHPFLVNDLPVIMVIGGKRDKRETGQYSSGNSCA